MLKWFYGVVSDKETFLHFIETDYTYQKLISIHPVELKEIAEEALFHAKKFKVDLPEYFAGMADDPMSYSQQALDQGIEPDYSEITKINEQQGTDYKNMIEYLQEMRKHVKPLVPGKPINDPLTVIAKETAEAGECDAIDDEDAYLKAVAGS